MARTCRLKIQICKCWSILSKISKDKRSLQETGRKGIPLLVWSWEIWIWTIRGIYQNPKFEIWYYQPLQHFGTYGQERHHKESILLAIYATTKALEYPRVYDLPIWLWSQKQKNIIHNDPLRKGPHERLRLHFFSVFHTSQWAAICEGAKKKLKAKKGFLGLFLKKGKAHSIVEFMYITPYIDYYTEPHKYNKSQFSLYDQEFQWNFG